MQEHRKINIKEYGADKLPDLYAIQEDAVKPYENIVPGFMGRLISLDGLRKQVEEGVRYFVAESGGKPVGWIGFIIKGSDTAMVRGLFIARESQGAGVGGALLKRFEQEARRGGAKRAILLALSDAIWAVEFYKKHGFEETVEGKQEVIARYWPPVPFDVLADYPDIPMSLLIKTL